ncbi:Metallo-dependent phosphatase-like protein [Absidia repens]|uniref:Metallo-dependent phosphatase-like protein n=1 Tax=Absidia repens TaxID=90262 RepID=A0A1X2IEB2_9FUNG|nr:Metallo-dependent phosphatase-like protein [Absidia repens]
MLQPNYEPYSSVSFQAKQRTSPYPTDSTTSSNPYPLLKSYDLGHHPSSLGFLPWRRKRHLLSKRSIFLLALAVLFLLIIFRHWVALYWAFFRIKLDNKLFDDGWIPCGTIRKEPMLYVHDTQHVQVVWEMNCDMKDMTISWQPSTSTATSWHVKQVEPMNLDERHALYKTVIGPLDSLDTIHYRYRIETKRKRRIRQYTFAWGQHSTSPPTTTAGTTTNNNRDARIRIAAMADNQFGLRTFLRILGQVHKHQPDYLLHAGDAVQNYPSLQQWQTDFVGPLTYFGLGQHHPMIYAHGNHDHDPTYEYHYTRTSTTRDPWHAFSLAGGAIRFIILDSNLDWYQQDEWLQKELASEQTRQAAFRIVVVHVPPFLEYWDPEAWFQQHQNEWGAFVRDRFVPLFEAHGVDWVISGHQHNYELGQRNNIHYAIIGGAGGDVDFDRVHDWGMYESHLLNFHFVIMDLEPVKDILNGDERENWKLIWNTYDQTGERIDHYELIKPRHPPSLSSDNDDDDKDIVGNDRGAVDGDIIQDITLMDMDDQQQ